MRIVSRTAQNRLSSPFARAIKAQPFRRETGDGGVVLTSDGQIYRLESVLGVGGLSTVYRATRYIDGQKVALKLAVADSEVAAVLLRRECNLLGVLRHPKIVSVVESGYTQNGEPFLAMQLAPGTSLDKVLMGHGRGLPLDASAEICLEVADALSYSHMQGIIHRDIKPANILIDGETGRVTLIDFGIAVFEGGRDDIPNKSCGSLFYVPPEQLEREPVCQASDIYELALVFLEMVAGRLPFERTLEGAIAYKTGMLPLLPPDEEVYLPPDLRYLLMSCLSRHPHYRPAQMSDFASELRQIISKFFNPTRSTTYVA